ncbi:MAG: Hsp20 family protein [Rhodospirillaceae bacterium]|nr:Hsp20 family protein [Rhodospirillaceae bacterium]
MRTLDLSPLFRATVGFDNLARVLDTVTRFDEGQATYPPYNIVKSAEDAYRVTLAVAGFAAEDIDIQVENATLTVKGRTSQDAGDVTYLHRGIAGRSFERRFELADHIHVVGARMENGLLHVDLKREIPEALKPRRIAINGASSKPTLVDGNAKAA